MSVGRVVTPVGPLAAAADPGRVFRIGYGPEPWAWTPWQYAGQTGRFPGRWDDPRGTFRTVYAGRNLLACLLEVLARFRPDTLLALDLAGIDDDPEYPSREPGTVPLDWLSARQASSATLTGLYNVVTDRQSVATLRRKFLGQALRQGLPDLDAGALRLSAPRALTQQIAAWLYDLHDASGELFDGVQFESRHGDRLTLWAVFERADDGHISHNITHHRLVPLHPDHPDLVEALRLHHLSWETGTR